MTVRNISIRKTFIWNMAGSFSTAALSVLLLLIVSRFMENQEADTFAYAYSVGHLLVIIGLFQVRNFQSTDIKRAYSFSTYFFTRCFTTVLMALVTLGYLFFLVKHQEKAEILLWVALLRMIDALSDVFQGFFQQEERLDLAGQSLFFRNLVTLLVFLGSLLISHRLTIALSCACLGSAVTFYLMDIKPFQTNFKINWEVPAVSAIFHLLKETLPLFLTGFFITFIYNQPKYVLDDFLVSGLGVTGLQKDFNILFMPIFVMNLMMLFLRPQLTQLAIYEQKADWLAFRQLRRQLILVLSGLSFLILGISYLLGLPVLSLVFGTALTSYKTAFMLLMIGGVMSAFATLFDNLLTIFRCQRLLMFPYGLAVILSLSLSRPLIFNFGIDGTAYSFLFVMLIWLLAMALIYFRVEKKMLR